MKSVLTAHAVVPVLLALSASLALAQDVRPAPSPSPSPMPEDRMTVPTTPPPAPTEAVRPSDKAATPYAAQQAAGEWRSTKLVGLNVYNAAGEKIGDINDLILDPDGKVSNAVIGVGGFLGLGEKLVAVPFSDLKFSRDANGNERVTLNTSKETLESAPDFKFQDAKRS